MAAEPWPVRLRGVLALDLRRALVLGAARTPLDPPGGGAWLAAWSLACVTAGVSLLLGCGYHAGFSGLNALGTAYPPWAVQWFTALGGDAVPFALGLFFARRYPRMLWAVILAAVAAILYSRGLKPLFDAARPPAVLAAEGFNLIGPALRQVSFPSGHSVAAGTFCGVMVYYARWGETRMLWVLIGVLVGLSRVAVGVHWPVDVAFGLAGGVLSAWLGARLAARWQTRATDVRTHLGMAGLCAVGAVAVLVTEGDYPLARPLLQALAAGALLWGLGGYVLVPLGRAVWARRKRGFGAGG
jgi:membrane-associated phospholipid phosphatase